MAIKETNKQMMIVISKEDYARLEVIAKKQCRSVSKQALLFVLQGVEELEKRKD
ncbi:MAG: hypothetical protein LUH05_04080 [Candidatus Gastranaerophilales bacterium]|nr:hypothetical protein [Candidatus Gastranaerophilales bacterium]